MFLPGKCWKLAFDMAWGVSVHMIMLFPGGGGSQRCHWVFPNSTIGVLAIVLHLLIA